MLRPLGSDLTFSGSQFLFVCFLGVCVYRKSYYKACHPEGFLKDVDERARSIAPGH